jgi:threonine dehydrogenase-like Zn-dependent dehydrogenase
MKGIVFLGDRRVELQEFPDPTPGPRDVILEIKASGMCGTDLKAYRASSSGDRFSIAGHEPCGIVAEIGSEVSEREARIGARVMVHHYDGCGSCRHCKTGWTQLCDDGSVAFGSGKGHGGHARYMSVPAHTIIPLPDDLSFATGAAISCGTGTAYGALKRLHVEGDETVTIFGQGPVGLSATQFGAAMGARVIAVEISPERRQLALEKGADVAIDPSETDPVAAILELTHGEGTHKAIETSGNTEARAAAVRGTRTWGETCLIAGGGELSLNVGPDLTHRQKVVMGHWTFSKTGQADCARFVADRKIDVDSIFTHRWTLDQGDEAYRLLDQQKTGKGVFLPG